MTLDSTKLTKVKNAIIAKINNAISIHNNDNSAHSTLFNSKADMLNVRGGMFWILLHSIFNCNGDCKLYDSEIIDILFLTFGFYSLIEGRVQE